MLSNKQLDNLLFNWGELADALECKCEVRVYDPSSPWECFLYAMDNDQDTVKCIIHSGKGIAVIEEWSLNDILMCYNIDGEHPKIDKEFVPRQASVILQKLKEGSL